MRGAEQVRGADAEGKLIRLATSGRYHWNKLTPPELTKSISFFQQAIELDPGYALAYAGLLSVLGPNK